MTGIQPVESILTEKPLTGTQPQRADLINQFRDMLGEDEPCWFYQGKEHMNPPKIGQLEAFLEGNDARNTLRKELRAKLDELEEERL